mmetsp:Transcript_111540/g.314956  ORF Transcript_111540/g.314956 Transcript_111540/m.314956 type:complete len:221 (-) Transcript_111540:372-1034(-)
MPALGPPKTSRNRPRLFNLRPKLPAMIKLIIGTHASERRCTAVLKDLSGALSLKNKPCNGQLKPTIKPTIEPKAAGFEKAILNCRWKLVPTNGSSLQFLLSESAVSTTDSAGIPPATVSVSSCPSPTCTALEPPSSATSSGTGGSGTFFACASFDATASAGSLRYHSTQGITPNQVIGWYSSVKVKRRVEATSKHASAPISVSLRQMARIVTSGIATTLG